MKFVGLARPARELNCSSVYEYDNEHWMALEDWKDNGTGGWIKWLVCLLCCLSAGFHILISG